MDISERFAVWRACRYDQTRSRNGRECERAQAEQVLELQDPITVAMPW